jgi:hypothetical protein
MYVISGFRHEVAENCALLGYYTASSGNFLLTFRDNLSVPSSRFKKPKEVYIKLRIGAAGYRMGLIGCPETSVRNYYYSLRNNAEERSSYKYVLQLIHK